MLPFWGLALNLQDGGLGGLDHSDVDNLVGRKGGVKFGDDGFGGLFQLQLPLLLVRGWAGEVHSGHNKGLLIPIKLAGL